MSKETQFNLFSNEGNSTKLYAALQETRRLFHRKEIAMAFEKMFHSLLEAEKSSIELTNSIQLTYSNDFTDQERQALELHLSDISFRLLCCISRFEMIGFVYTLSDCGKEKLKKINEDINQATNIAELTELLQQTL